MSWKFKVSDAKFTLLDDRQWYPARLLNVTPDEMEWKGKIQAKFKFHFAILDPVEFEGKEVQGQVNQPSGSELNERHFLFQWITALAGRPPCVGDNLTFPEDFLGKICLIQVKSTKKNYDGREMVFQNVDRLTICANTGDYEDRAPDKMPGGLQPSQPKEEPRAPESNQQPQSQLEPERTSSVLVDGEDIDIPF